MDDSDDIANLFKQFGGRPDNYQEIGRANEAKLSRERWPLLSSVEATQASQFPPVDPGREARPATAAVPPPPAAPVATPVVQAATPPHAPAREAVAAKPSPVAPPAEARTEPHFSSLPAFAAPSVAAAAAAPAPAAPSTPQAEFIAPRPRSAPATRPATVNTPSPLTRLSRPAPEPVAAVEPQTTAQPPASASRDLQSIFARLAQPQPPADTRTESDKNATLLQRLSRL
jgi:hypothetical protein